MLAAFYFVKKNAILVVYDSSDHFDEIIANSLLKK